VGDRCEGDLSDLADEMVEAFMAAAAEDDEGERLDVHNGLLLSALWDAAFDRGLVSFDDDGQPLFSSGLGEMARSALRWQQPIALTDKHRARLAWHRSHLFNLSSQDIADQAPLSE
jgi:predicted restriction endonuclease